MLYLEPASGSERLKRSSWKTYKPALCRQQRLHSCGGFGTAICSRVALLILGGGSAVTPCAPTLIESPASRHLRFFPKSSKNHIERFRSESLTSGGNTSAVATSVPIHLDDPTVGTASSCAPILDEISFVECVRNYFVELLRQLKEDRGRDVLFASFALTCCLFLATTGIGVQCRSQILTCDMASLGGNVAMVTVTDELDAATLNKRLRV